MSVDRMAAGLEVRALAREHGINRPVMAVRASRDVLELWLYGGGVLRIRLGTGRQKKARKEKAG
jgi:hypothetical protein